MAAGNGIVAWLRERKHWQTKGQEDGLSPTHLFLTGGKARVPDDMATLFLNAYANAIVRGDTPSISECRTPVFRLFMDLDIKAKTSSLDTLRDIGLFIAQQASMFFVCEVPEVTVLTTQPKVIVGTENVKHGVHLVWANVFTSSHIALAFRTILVEKLETKFKDLFCISWDSIVDVCVYKSSGLRMPFSYKGTEPRFYAPSATILGSMWHDTPAPATLTVSFVREWVLKTSIRAPGILRTPLHEGIEVPDGDGKDHTLDATYASLSEFAHVLPRLDAALPFVYVGQKFVSVLRMDNCFIIRSSSRYCANLGRAHNTNNVYFVLTRQGISQRCYCRCETTDGRKFGMCKDFSGECHEVHAEIIDAFFGESTTSTSSRHSNTATTTIAPLPLPSQSMRASFNDLDALLRKSRPALKKRKSKKKT